MISGERVTLYPRASMVRGEYDVHRDDGSYLGRRLYSVIMVEPAVLCEDIRDPLGTRLARWH